jgi:hypothetical protein
VEGYGFSHPVFVETRSFSYSVFVEGHGFSHAVKASNDPALASVAVRCPALIPAPQGRANLAQRRGPQLARFWPAGVEGF